MKVTQEKFFNLISEFDVIPFEQSKGWHDSIDFPNREYHIDSDENPQIGFCGLVTNSRILGKKLIIESYCHKNGLSAKQITQFFKDIIDSGDYEIVYLSDIEQVNPSVQVALRRAGFLRPLAMKLCPMSLIVDTDKDFNFHRNWRRGVNKSIKSGNNFEVHVKPDSEILKAFVVLFNELRDRKSLSFGLTESGLKSLFDTPDYVLSMVRDPNGKPLCGRITYIKNGHSYDVFAANSDESLAVGAVYHNQQSLLEYLKSIGCMDFDYGRIPPGRDAMDNIYLAKSYSGGYPVVYNGEWEYTKSNLKNWLYSMYRYCFHKSKRY